MTSRFKYSGFKVLFIFFLFSSHLGWGDEWGDGDVSIVRWCRSYELSSDLLAPLWGVPPFSGYQLSTPTHTLLHPITDGGFRASGEPRSFFPLLLLPLDLPTSPLGGHRNLCVSFSHHTGKPDTLWFRPGAQLPRNFSQPLLPHLFRSCWTRAPLKVLLTPQAILGKPGHRLPLLWDSIPPSLSPSPH